VVPELLDVGLKICHAIGNTAFGVGIDITHDQEKRYRRSFFRTMEFWLMSSEKVAVGLMNQMVRSGSRLIVSHGGTLM